MKYSEVCEDDLTIENICDIIFGKLKYARRRAITVRFVVKVDNMMMPMGEMMRLAVLCVQRMPDRA